MFIILKNAEEVTDTYKRVASMSLEIEALNSQLDVAASAITSLNGKIATLELENETLQREVEHWKAEAAEVKRKVTLHRLK